jgi:hypothetical protein
MIPHLTIPESQIVVFLETSNPIEYEKLPIGSIITLDVEI